MSRKKKSASAPLPTKADILKYVAENPGKLTKRDIARAFQVRGSDRIYLKQLLKELIAEGALERGFGRTIATPGALPRVTVIEVTGVSFDGEVLARPASRRHEEKPPIIFVKPERGRRLRALGIRDRALARLEPNNDRGDTYSARVIRIIESAPSQILGIFREGLPAARIQPTDKRERSEFTVAPSDSMNAKNGELVLAELLPARGGRYLGLKPARVVERLGDLDEPKSISLIAIHAHGIPTEFPGKSMREAEAAVAPELGKREDLRSIPLITIDPADARDFDDAVWAAPDDDPKNPGGWQVMVAIADVAHFVRPGSALDREARRRGNSCYFPDRVVPMLPEALSNELCSLKPDEDRACLAVRMWFDKDGRKLRHAFTRGLMRSAARLSYGDAQSAADGDADSPAAPYAESHLKPLYGAYAALMRARAKRQPLDLDLPERRIELNDLGEVEAITVRERLDAHRLIEEFMIQANVAAAETLEAKRTPCMYRVHDEPSLEKVEALREFLASLDLKLARGQVMRPELFNRLLAQATGAPHFELLSIVILRSQMQAYYAPDQAGHFGLALPRYAHFTSPIRRYADILVHRGLIRALGLGAGGLGEEDAENMAETGELISNAERRAMAAERDSADRYLAAHFKDKIGAEFEGKISGVSRFGLFVRLEPSGADGLVPVSSIASDYFDHVEAQHALIGRRTGKAYRLGDSASVRLAEANGLTGGIKLELLSEPSRLPTFLRNAPRRRAGKPKGKSGKRQRS